MATLVRTGMTGQRAGTPAIIGILAAIGGIVVSFALHPGWGALLAVIAIACGAIGMVMAASPRVSGGVMSLAAIVLGIFGLGLAVLVMAGLIVF